MQDKLGFLSDFAIRTTVGMVVLIASHSVSHADFTVEMSGVFADNLGDSLLNGSSVTGESFVITASINDETPIDPTVLGTGHKIAGFQVDHANIEIGFNKTFEFNPTFLSFVQEFDSENVLAMGFDNALENPNEFSEIFLIEGSPNMTIDAFVLAPFELVGFEYGSAARISNSQASGPAVFENGNDRLVVGGFARDVCSISIVSTGIPEPVSLFLVSALMSLNLTVVRMR